MLPVRRATIGVEQSVEDVNGWVYPTAVFVEKPEIPLIEGMAKGSPPMIVATGGRACLKVRSVHAVSFFS